MAIPDDVRAAAVEQVAAFCESRIPADLLDRIRLEHEVRGDSIAIRERRPPWNPELGPEWTSTDIARLSYDASSRRWSLQWKRSDGRWYAYEGTEAAQEIAPLLAEIDADPDGVFWG